MDIYKGSNDFLGNIDTMWVSEALIEEIVHDNEISYVTVSYGVWDGGTMTHMDRVILVVFEDTIILDPFGQSISMGDLRKGMIIDADFSYIMTRSIPPQSRAYRIIVKSKQEDIIEKTDRVLNIDIRNNFLYTGPANDLIRQMRYVITDSTLIRDRIGNRIGLKDLKPGQMVRVEHAIFQTASIPPQTTAFSVQLL